MYVHEGGYPSPPHPSMYTQLVAYSTCVVSAEPGQELKANVLLYTHLGSMDLEDVGTALCVCGGGWGRGKVCVCGGVWGWGGRGARCTCEGCVRCEM